MLLLKRAKLGTAIVNARSSLLMGVVKRLLHNKQLNEHAVQSRGNCTFGSFYNFHFSNSLLNHIHDIFTFFVFYFFVQTQVVQVGFVNLSSWVTVSPRATQIARVKDD